MVILQNLNAKNILISLLVFTNLTIFLSVFLLSSFYIFILFSFFHVIVIILCVFYFRNYYLLSLTSNINPLSVTVILEKSLLVAAITSLLISLIMLIIKIMQNLYFNVNSIIYPIVFIIITCMFNFYIINVYRFECKYNISMKIYRSIFILIISLLFKFAMISTAFFGAVAMGDYSDFIPYYVFNLRFPVGYFMVFVFYSAGVCFDCAAVFSFSREEK